MNWQWIYNSTSESLRRDFQEMATYLFRKGVSFSSKASVSRLFVFGEAGDYGFYFVHELGMSAMELAYYTLFDQSALELQGEVEGISPSLKMPIPYSVISEVGEEPDWSTLRWCAPDNLERIHHRSCLLELVSSSIARDGILTGT